MNKVAALALSKKAENVISLDLRGLTSTCDFFLICSGTSDVHVKAIVDAIVEGMKEAGERPWHVEGYEARKWALVDYVNVVVHVFDTQTRDYYELERLWGDAKFEEYKDEE
ncbi:MAG: ribosome silencing factor [Candidatus Eisenbacteria bacterium]|nr:ribosome silencing factor [Candidatus Eisenbacteria bacterium]